MNKNEKPQQRINNKLTFAVMVWRVSKGEIEQNVLKSINYEKSRKTEKQLTRKTNEETWPD